MPDQIGLILLAAGGSSRMGRPKQLLRYKGRTLLAIAADHALASSCRPIVVVLGAEAEACRHELRGREVEIVQNDAWAAGMGTSIRAGLSHLISSDKKTSCVPVSASLAGVLVILCDQPKVDGKAIDLFVAEFRRGEKDLVATRYADSLGVPALFGRRYFPMLLGLPDDKGAKAILMKYRDQAGEIELPAAAVDVDTPEDFFKLR